MSTLQVTKIVTVDNNTPLILSTGNAGGGQIIVQSANTDVVFSGNLHFTQYVTGDGSGLYIPTSNVANAAFNTANAAFASANNVAPQVTPAFNTANGAFDTANAAFASANNVAPQVTPSFNKANAAYTTANAAFDYANASNTFATSTFIKQVAPSQTITGDLAVTGNLTFLGNAATISSNNLIVGDSMIYLAANNYSGTDILDIGFVANYGNTTGANVHTGLLRDATTKQYYLFNGLDIELHENNTAFVPYANGVTNAVLNADLYTSNLSLGGANAINWITAAYAKANASGANVGQTAPASANGALWWNSDLGRLFIYYTDPANTGSWVEASPSAATIEAAIITGYINPVYNASNAAYTTTNAAYTTTNAAFSKANSALPNTTNAVFQGNLTITGALTIGQNTVVITETSVNVANAVIISSQGLTVPRGNTSQRPSGVALGTIRYNTDSSALENYTTSGWLKVSIPIPGIASISGYIYNSVTSTLTLTGSGFGTAAGNVTFTSGATTATVSATPTNDASVSVVVPSSIYNLSVGTSVSIKYTNADGGISGTTTSNIISLPTGGTVTTSGGYRYHTFTSSDSFVVPNTAISSIDATLVAGGGGGARNRGGGGGAGGMVTYTSIGNVATGTYTVTIGSGGLKQTSTQDSTQGNLTSFVGGAISWSVTGGGRGGGNGYGLNYAGGSGGSGGGAGSQSSQSGGSGTSGQGNAGGSTGSYSSGAGGGGKGSAGTNATGGVVAGGTGAAGINGTTYATGGAGGNGVDATGGGAAGTVNTGNGGDGGSGNVDGGAGGSGIFVLRYLLPS